jgi:hypothetical protein
MTKITDKLRGDMPKGKGTIFYPPEGRSLGVRIIECFQPYFTILFLQEP